MSRALLDVGDNLQLRRLDPPDAEVLQVIIEADRVERGGGRGSTGYHDLVVYSMLENEWRAS